jgi:hypothetical protein
MNEQIKQLAEQAGFTVENGHIQSLAYKQTEKLAELIVKECAELCDNLQKWPSTEPRHCADDIKQHFGV